MKLIIWTNFYYSSYGDEAVKPEEIPDLEDRQKKADQLEEMFMETITEEPEYTEEKLIYKQNQVGQAVL